MVTVWHLNLRHLAAAAEIARRGTIAAAAGAVNLTQPAITQALARLERQLGLRLFERRHDGMIPAEAAAIFVPRIEAALAHVGTPHATMARLRALVALADTGSYAGAGIEAGLSQPSVHRAVNDLATALRRTLVERRGKSVALSEEGRQLARSFRLAAVELEAGLAEIEALKGRETGRIVIGAMPLSRARLLPGAILRLQRRHPGVTVKIVEGARADLVEPLRGGALDLMIGALREPLLEADLVQEALFTDVPAVIGRKGHPLAARPSAPGALVAYPWTVPARGVPLRTSFERYFRDAGLAAPDVPIECGSMMTIRQILTGSDYLTILSPDQVAVELEAGWLERIADLPSALGRVIGVTTRSAWHPTALQRAFLADLRDMARTPHVGGGMPAGRTPD